MKTVLKVLFAFIIFSLGCMTGIHMEEKYNAEFEDFLKNAA